MSYYFFLWHNHGLWSGRAGIKDDSKVKDCDPHPDTCLQFYFLSFSTLEFPIHPLNALNASSECTLLESWGVCVLAHTASGLVLTDHKVAKEIITSYQPAICLVHTIVFLNRTLSERSLCARHCPGGLNAWVIQSSQWSCGVAIISHMSKPGSEETWRV